MQLINNTPFVPVQFESIDKQLNLFGTTAIRGTFDIHHEKRLSIAQEQETLVLTDEYFGDANGSSLRFQTSLVPYKPRTDLLIEATAHAPGGTASRSWNIGLIAGPIKKQFQVTGKRSWQPKFGGYQLGEIEPTASVDIRYELACGGNMGAGEPDMRNPVGVGRRNQNGSQDIPCPQLLPINMQSPELGQPLPVLGLGPLAPSWQPRLACAGTYDERWKSTRWPYLPLDFDFQFYNAAPNDQSFAGFAKGDETIRLFHLSPHGDLVFGLPGIQLMHVIQFDDGRLIPAPIQLDTIHIDTSRMKVMLEWRGIYPLHIPIKRMEIRLSAPESLKAA